MARGEGDTGLKSNFVERVVKLPMVHVVWDYASNTYSHIKESNKLVNFTLTNAEKTANFVAGQARPVVLKFEKQIQVVDDLACKGLGTLEEKVPFIKKPADEIIVETRKLYTDSLNNRLGGIVKYGNETVRSAADFGLRQVTNVFGERLVNSALSTVDGILVVTQNYLDHYMTPEAGEKTPNGVPKEKDAEKPSPLTRVVRITNTVRRRTYKAILVRIENIQERSLDLLITYPVQLMEFSKTHFDAFVEYANKFWIALRSGEVDEADAAERSRVEQQLLHLARMVSRQVAHSSLAPPESTSQEPTHGPVVITAVRDGAMWVMGMLKLVPQLLPMYLYGFTQWLERKRYKKTVSDDTKPEGEVKENGVGPHHSNDHSHSNNVYENHVEEEAH